MKYKYQRPDYAPVLKSTLPDIGDTILGNVCLQDFWSSLVNEEKTPLAGKMLESGLGQAGGHPISVQCPDLVLECAKAYHPNTREVISSNNKVIVRLYPASIAIVFRLPTRMQYANINLRTAQEYFTTNQTQCLNTIARSWFSQPRRGKSQLGKSIHRSLLKEEVANMVTLLSRIVGLHDSHEFEGWMFLFINMVCEGKQHIDWAEIISDSLHRKLMGLQEI